MRRNESSAVTFGFADEFPFAKPSGQGRPTTATYLVLADNSGGFALNYMTKAIAT